MSDATLDASMATPEMRAAAALIHETRRDILLAEYLAEMLGFGLRPGLRPGRCFRVDELKFHEIQYILHGIWDENKVPATAAFFRSQWDAQRAAQRQARKSADRRC